MTRMEAQMAASEAAARAGLDTLKALLPPAAGTRLAAAADALDRFKVEVRRTEDYALLHELNGLSDRIQVPDVDVTVVDKALELLRGHAQAGHDGPGERSE